MVAAAATAGEGQFRNPAGEGRGRGEGGYGYYGWLCHALSLSLSLCGSTGSSHVSYLLRYVEIGERGETGGGEVRWSGGGPSRDPFARCDFRFHLVDPNRHGSTARSNFIWTRPWSWSTAGRQPSRSWGEALGCSSGTLGKFVFTLIVKESNITFSTTIKNELMQLVHYCPPCSLSLMLVHRIPGPSSYPAHN